MKPWPLVILILALGSSALNAWFFGSLIYDDRARAHNANPLLGRTDVFGIGDNTGGAVDRLLADRGDKTWNRDERREWRVMVTVELAMITLAGASYALVRPGRTAARP